MNFVLPRGAHPPEDPESRKTSAPNSWLS